jgi:hypothetical protein
MELPLKLGSKGEDVKILQQALEIEDDGDFGPMTELAVKAFQRAIGLKDDGVVGPKTANALGLLDSDQSSIENKELKFERAWMDKDEYFPGPTDKRWVFLHHTAGWHNPFGTIKNWNSDDRGKVGTEFVLGGPSIKGNDNQYDGVLVQAFPEGGYAWHNSTGSGPIHTQSVGIEVCNFGYLTKGGYRKQGKWIALNPNEYYNYVGVAADLLQITVLDKAFRGYTHWHKYSEKQIEVLRDWILWVCKRDGINPKKGIVEQIHRLGAHAAFDLVDISLATKNPGIWLHTNTTKGKVDLFPQKEVVDMLMSL